MHNSLFGILFLIWYNSLFGKLCSIFKYILLDLTSDKWDYSCSRQLFRAVNAVTTLLRKICILYSVLLLCHDMLIINAYCMCGLLSLVVRWFLLVGVGLGRAECTCLASSFLWRFLPAHAVPKQTSVSFHCVFFLLYINKRLLLPISYY